MARGKFITFEGGEGSGKSTQVAALATALKERGVGVLVTREPGGTPFAEEVRNFLLFGPGRATPGTPLAEALLFYAARADHIARKIGPELAAGSWVICDRFIDSTRAYQGAASGVDAKTLLGLESIVLGDCKPDLTFILDLPADVGLARAEARRNKELAPASFAPERDLFEGRDISFHQRLRLGFQRIASGEPQRCVLIDATRGVDEISLEIGRVVDVRLGPL